MHRSRTGAWLVAAAVAAALALGAGAGSARAAGSCGIVTAAGHSWIVVANGVACGRAKQVVRGFAARTARIRNGQHVTVPSPLHGFTCVLASRGKPAGSCSTVGATKSLVWITS
jgi:hypothetical protein